MTTEEIPEGYGGKKEGVFYQITDEKAKDNRQYRFHSCSKGQLRKTPDMFVDTLRAVKEVVGINEKFIFKAKMFARKLDPNIELNAEDIGLEEVVK